MDNQLILIADADAKNLQILKDNLEASGFLVSAVTNGKDAWEEILRTSPKLIISETNLPGLSGYQLLERINSDLKTSSIPLIFLTKQREVQQRIKGFEMGAKDYLVKPLHVKEVIAHIRMVVRRIEQRKIDQIEKYNKFSGKLDQLALADLIESFGIERKTGILTVNNGKRTGQIFFREGSVVNASLEDFKTEQAVYQMFPWQTGYFNMIFRDVDVADKISISNLGLLLQGIKRLEIRQQLIKQLPSSETAFTVSPTFKTLVEKKKVGNGAGSFIALLDGKRNVEQIVDESKLDDLIAIKRLVRLYQQGFIKPTIATKKQPAPLPKIIEPAEKVTFIKKHQIPLEMKFDKEIATPSLESSATNDYMLHEHTAKQEQKVQELAQQEKTNVEPTPENKKIQENKIDTELMAQSTPVLKDKEKTGFPEDQIASSFNESDNENVFALKPPLKEKEISISKEELSEKPVAENNLKTENLKSSQNSTLEFQTPALNQLPPAFDNKISENNFFQIKPTKNQQDLEKEIIPLIERIEQQSQPSSENEKEHDKQAAEPAIKEAASDASTNFEAPITQKDSKEKKFDDSDLTFIDEELPKQY